jgi:alginate O-acetyltransferase complex protein AlgI
MVIPSGFALDATTQVALTRERLVVLVLASTVVLLPRGFVFGRVLDVSTTRIAAFGRFAICAIGAPYAALLVAAGTFSPFLYFQF